jgi:exopolyphosphatase/guanosine-5'-triphosphate,3'-diphosphate pyrophosphatase
MMILTEPLPAFSRTEVKIIANVARYHRKTLPALEHTVYGTLSEEDRRRVNVLAAILRIADALDRSKRAAVNELTCDVTEDSVIFNLIADTELQEEEAAVSRRGDLFAAVFRKAPRVQVQLPKLASPQAVFQLA